VGRSDALNAALGRGGNLGQGRGWQIRQLAAFEVGSEDAAWLVR
jgi:hypothetical protein